MYFDKMPTPKRKLSPMQSIKFYCKHICCANDRESWKNCNAKRCSLFRYRLGKRPIKIPFTEYMKPKSQKASNENKQALLPIKTNKNSELNHTHQLNPAPAINSSPIAGDFVQNKEGGNSVSS